MALAYIATKGEQKHPIVSQAQTAWKHVLGEFLLSKSNRVKFKAKSWCPNSRIPAGTLISAKSWYPNSPIPAGTLISGWYTRWCAILQELNLHGTGSQVLKFKLMLACVAGYANSTPTIRTVSQLIKKASWQNGPSMPCLA